MHAPRLRHWTAACALSWSMVAVGTGNGAATSASGDLLVKFSDTSSAGQLMQRAVRGEVNTAKELADLATRLSRELGVALSVVRISAGRELILSVERGRLAVSLARRVQRDPAVRRATPLAQAKTILPPAQIAVVVELVPESDASQQLRRAAGGDAALLKTIVARFTPGVEPRPLGRIDARGRLVLTIDIAELTRDLTLRFQRRADVEYAQVNQILKPLPRTAPN
jgi:hypothetical protein